MNHKKEKRHVFPFFKNITQNVAVNRRNWFGSWGSGPKKDQ